MPKLLIMRDLVICVKNRATRNLEWLMWTFLELLCGALAVITPFYIGSILFVVDVGMALPLAAKIYISATTVVSMFVIQQGLVKLINVFHEMAEYVGYKK